MACTLRFILFIMATAISPASLRADEIDQRLVDFLSVFFENAKSFRSYDVTIDFSAVFDPYEKRSSEPLYLKELQIRLVMDWEKQRYFRVKRLRIESETKSETFGLVRFEDNVEIRRDLASKGRPVVRNVAFHESLRTSDIPIPELASLLHFPGKFTRPLDQMQARIKNAPSETKTSFRFLPDGTGVRTVASPESSISVTHFDPKSLMPSMVSVKSEGLPELTTRTVFEEVDGIFRPRKMTVTQYEITSQKFGGEPIYMTGTGVADFRWHSFNEKVSKLPDDSALLDASPAKWIELLKLD